jgi:hypothetical protein
VGSMAPPSPDRCRQRSRMDDAVLGARQLLNGLPRGPWPVGRGLTSDGLEPRRWGLGDEPRERSRAGVTLGIVELLLDPQQLVVSGDLLPATSRASAKD